MRRIRRQHAASHTPQHVRVLCTGRDLHRTFHPSGPFAVATRQRDFTFPEIEEQRMREAWSELRDDIIANYKFRRPFAWWAFESTEPRRRLRHDHEHHQGSGLYFGLPAILFCPLSCKVDAAASDYETEIEYLARLNLLTAAERAELELLEHGSQLAATTQGTA